MYISFSQSPIKKTTLPSDTLYLQLNLIFWGPDSNEWSITPWIVSTVGWLVGYFPQQKFSLLGKKLKFAATIWIFYYFQIQNRTIRRNTISLFLLKNITEQNNFLNIFYFGDFFKICTWEPVCTVFVNSWPVLRNFSYSFKTCTRDPEIYVLRISSTDHREIQLIFVFSP